MYAKLYFPSRHPFPAQSLSSSLSLCHNAIILMSKWRPGILLAELGVFECDGSNEPKQARTGQDQYPFRSYAATETGPSPPGINCWPGTW